MKILTAAQHAQLDLHTIEHEPIASIDLMERASKAVAREIAARWDARRSVYVFAGAGNNGGDGLAVARLLSRQGYRVSVYLFNIKGKLSADCQTNWERLQEMSEVDVHEITQGFDFPQIHTTDVVVDALFGTGLRTPLSGGFAAVARKINSVHALVVSIDVPSGLMSEDNAFVDRNAVVHAELTLTIGLPKLFLLMADNETCVGDWKVLDIGYDRHEVEQTSTPYALIDDADVREIYRPRPRFAHKGMMGHALLVSGCYGMAGATVLSARGCLRSGVGKLSVHMPSSNVTIMQMGVPEAVLLPSKSTRHVADVVDISMFKAIGIGPGLGMDDETKAALQQYLSLADEPLVLDADALNILGLHRDWMSQVPPGSIFTPHVKELEGLVGHCNNSYERLTRASELAVRSSIYVILKGHNTAICTPQGRVLFCQRGNPGMATPGSGDVLTGVLTGLLAQGYAPLEACVLGVWLHAAAGDYAAAELSEESMLASDIISHLGKAFATLSTDSQKTGNSIPKDRSI
ncbi:MAG: NAD(P)H-hydrate dehydratase [Bacteroidales bacterium]|nr:NAD(P)H-hydrate dehydratase [Candidatus Physcousia equi]